MFLNRFATRIVAFLLFVFGGVLAAQTTAVTPDDRYDGYRGVRIEWPTGQPDLTRCKAAEYYEPSADNLFRFAINVARVRIQEYDECTWMITTTGWRYVLRRAGTRVAVDARGRDLYDYGRGDGKVCRNPRPIAVPYKPAQPPPPPPPPPALVRITVQKEFLLANGKWASPVPSFPFRVEGNGVNREATNGADGKVTLSLKPGCYQVVEREGEGYELLSVVPEGGRVCLTPGEHKSVLFKNRQVLPPPAPTHVHAVCEGFLGIPEQPMSAGTAPFKVTPQFRGEVVDLEWSQEGIEGGVKAPAININPAGLTGAARFRVTAKDSENHLVTCSFVVTVTPAPPQLVGYCQQDHNWLVDITWGQIRCHPVRTITVVCAATAVASYGTSTFIPPCGWWGRGTELIKPRVPVPQPRP